EDGKRQVGLTVWDRANQSMQPVVELSDALAGARTEEERAAIRARLDAAVKSWGPHPAALRFFAGKTLDDAVVQLADKEGRPRLLLKVDGSGNPTIETLDESGKVTHHLP